MGQHGKYLFWPQLLHRSSFYLAVFTDVLKKRISLYAMTKEIGKTVAL